MVDLDHSWKCAANVSTKPGGVPFQLVLERREEEELPDNERGLTRRRERLGNNLEEKD